jgi:hypothetical protein
MPSLTPAQIANQVTFVLKGHLKNARIGYIRAASLLARVREEKLWKALGHATIEEYAERQSPASKPRSARPRLRSQPLERSFPSTRPQVQASGCETMNLPMVRPTRRRGRC